MKTLQVPRWMLVAQAVLLGLTVVLVMVLGGRLQRLESRMEALRTEQMALVSQRASSPPASRGGASQSGDRDLATRVVRSAAPVEAAEDGEVAASTIDDHLWSEGGRQAIGDVVEEREDADRERRTERWKQMTAYRTEKAVGAVSEQLNLSEREAEEISTLVSAYMEVRSSRWRKMSGDEEVDIADIEREYEASKAEIEQDIVGVIGEDGLELLHEEMRSGWR